MGAGSQEQSDEALRRFHLALEAASYTAEDVRTLRVGITDYTYRAMLLVYADGVELWIIEAMRGNRFPPQNWSLAQWRARLHAEPCGVCCHTSADTIIGCECACHDLFAGILAS
jgi:hypothetical protein